MKGTIRPSSPLSVMQMSHLPSLARDRSISDLSSQHAEASEAVAAMRDDLGKLSVVIAERIGNELAEEHIRVRRAGGIPWSTDEELLFAQTVAMNERSEEHTSELQSH